MRLDQAPLSLAKAARKLSKHAVWIAIALATGGAWIFYFNDAPTTLRQLVTGQASATVYGFIALFSATTYLLAGWAREQVCIYMCPWPRFQGAMFDEDTLLVTYEEWRGEPRRHVKAKPAEEAAGDCIDCGLCVRVCPTGIDIRKGQQLACIGCALCVDACNEVMAKIGRPRDLITYDSLSNQAARAAGRPTRLHPIRPRTIVYAALLAIIVVAMAVLLLNRDTLDVAIQPDRAPLFVPAQRWRHPQRLHPQDNQQGADDRTFPPGAAGPSTGRGCRSSAIPPTPLAKSSCRSPATASAPSPASSRRRAHRSPARAPPSISRLPPSKPNGPPAMPASSVAPRADAPTGRLYPWIFVAAMGLVILVNAVMIWFAVHSFTGLATEDPYDKGPRLQPHARRRRGPGRARLAGRARRRRWPGRRRADGDARRRLPRSCRPGARWSRGPRLPGAADQRRPRSRRRARGAGRGTLSHDRVLALARRMAVDDRRQEGQRDMAEHAAHPSALTALCRHCGEALPAAAGEFCCAGCEAAHRLIGELGLERYYRQRCLDPAQRRPRPDASAPVIVCHRLSASCGATGWPSCTSWSTGCIAAPASG